MSIGLALSGGGAKGIAHIGVIKALIDNGINIDYISGTSSGSIIASLFASGYSPNEILNIIIKNKKNIIDLNKKNINFLKILIKKEVNINGFVKGNNLENIVRKYLAYKNVIDINDIKIPIAITTVSLNDGRTIYFSNRKVREGLNELNINKGEVASIVRASLSVPGIFIPKKIEEKYYIDGGVNVNTPVNILRKMGADKIIAVSFKEKHKKFKIKNVVGISKEAIKNIHNSSNNEEENADINVRLCINNISIFDTSNSVNLANRGYNIVCSNICKIKKFLDIK